MILVNLKFLVFSELTICLETFQESTQHERKFIYFILFIFLLSASFSLSLTTDARLLHPTHFST
jgi:hypothetical protein